MGACSFGEVRVGKYKNYGEAYYDAVSDAIDEYGHQDGYNGTISTTDCPGSLRKDAPKYGTKTFKEFIYKQHEKLNKCDCEVIEIKGVQLKKLRERYNLVGVRGVKAYYFYGIARE
jgi:hypothetical protein